jgi:hypothetical protein
MTTEKFEQGCSSDSELLNAIQVVCHEAAAWLHQRPEIRDAARIILDSIFEQSAVERSPSAELKTNTSSSGGLVQAVSNVASELASSQLSSGASKATSSTNLDGQVEQSVADLTALVESELVEHSADDHSADISEPLNGEDTVFEPAAVVGSEFDSSRSSKPRYSEVSDDDLTTMIERCRLKAEGARWAIERDERIRDGADFKLEVKPCDLEIIDRAKQVPNCFLWMNQPRSDIRTQANDFKLIADCFDALAETIMTLNVSLTSDDAEQLIQAVELVAEAQSGLRTAVSRVEDHPDTDQQLAYHWLRNRASKDRFYISRFMKITDPAEPENCLNIQQQAIEFREATRIASPSKQKNSWLEKARFHLRKIASDPIGADDYDWTKVADAVDRWVTDGGSINSRELRDLLVPVIDDVPDIEFAANFENVIDLLISTSVPESAPQLDVPMLEHALTKNQPIAETNEVETDSSLEVKQVSQWLRDKRLLLFAGELDQELFDQIVQSFQLASLTWVPQEQHHAEIDTHNNDVDLVAVLVTNQWETLLWDEVSETTTRTSLPAIRLPSNCNPHQIAVQVIKQCPDRLSDGEFQSSVA